MEHGQGRGHRVRSVVLVAAQAQRRPPVLVAVDAFGESFAVTLVFGPEGVQPAETGLSVPFEARGYESLITSGGTPVFQPFCSDRCRSACDP